MPDPDRRRPVALVSGSSSEIGQACLRQLADRGFAPVAGWRSDPEPPPPAVRFDTTSADGVDRAVELVEAEHGPLQAVVAVAGFAHLDLATRVPPERFRAVVDANLTGAFLLARAAARVMVKRRSGRIILIGSVAGLWGVPGVTPYAASKAGLGGFARSLAREVGGRNITVNVVAPGLLDNAVDRLRSLRPAASADAEWLQVTPAGRPGTAADIASAVAFLASDGAAAITGAVVPVDGGFGMGLA